MEDTIHKALSLRYGDTSYTLYTSKLGGIKIRKIPADRSTELGNKGLTYVACTINAVRYVQ